jgi:hypothetical protein
MSRAHVVADKHGRSHRRHREHRAAGLALIRAMHTDGHVIRCRLCGQSLDPYQPYDGGRNPWAPTLEHRQPLSQGGSLFQDNGPDSWAHKLCQSRQGQEMRRATSRQGPRRNSRRWT